NPVSARAVSRNVLLGRVPVLTRAPPISRVRSTRATRCPKIPAAIAPATPAGPAPITTRSNRCARTMSTSRELDAPHGHRPVPLHGHVDEQALAVHRRLRQRYVDVGPPVVWYYPRDETHPHVGGRTPRDEDLRTCSRPGLLT